jgi:hypothetical protein
MKVVWKNNDSSLIVSEHCHCDILPFLSAPDIFFHVIVYILLQVLCLMYNVCLVRECCVAS